MKPTRILIVATVLGAVMNPSAVRASDSLGDTLGTIHFEVAGSPEAQGHVVRGVKLLHHMMYLEADREFAQAVAADPKCALAHWGRAMAIIHPLWPDTPTEAELREGAEHIRRGLASPPATPRERAYLETLEAYFRDAVPGEHVSRLQALDPAWEVMARRFPNDLDAQAFSALFHLAPARFLPKDKSHRIQLTAGRLLQEVLQKVPDHPGAQHYKIHAFDFPLLADRALEVCDTYGSIAPDVPHALHMPTHIFTRQGLWAKSIEFNRRSAEAARKLNASNGAINGHQPHALDYLMYAHLQRGEYREADAIRRQVLGMEGPFHSALQSATAFAFAAIPARYALERQAWQDAAALPLHAPAAFSWSDKYLHCDSMVRFARAIGAARSGNLAAARAEIAEQARLHEQIAAKQPRSYWAAQAETQLLAAQAWVAIGSGAPEKAVELMRRAAELEFGIDKEAVTPGEVLPAGDLLGDLYLELGRHGEAIAAFEAVLEVSPNRLNTLLGAGKAAERAGDRAKAKRYYNQALEVASAADSGIARLEHARTYLAGNQEPGQ